MTSKEWSRQRVTIKDIAREAGVDPSTVTRALQGSPRVKTSTREDIERIALRLGYVPSAIGRSLVKRRSQLIGLVIPDMTNPFFAPLARGIEDEAARHSLRVLIRNTEGKPAAERDAINVFSELAVDGLIVPAARCPQSYYDALPLATPIIHINREDAAHQVSCDSVSGSAKIMAHLFALKHRRVAFVAGPAGPAREPKIFAYRQAMQNAQLPIRDEDLFSFDETLASVEHIADTLAANPQRPTAVFAWNDVCAIALIHALHKRGIEVPQQMSIAGHDDIEMAAIIQPPLTTVRWPMYELGLEAVRYVLRLHTKESPVSPIIPAPTLMVRESTAPPPG
ncbi:MAG: LacI family DNA-binding transcriptional regulator [Gammaproteobacteria bacterium]